MALKATILCGVLALVLEGDSPLLEFFAVAGDRCGRLVLPPPTSVDPFFAPSLVPFCTSFLPEGTGRGAGEDRETREDLLDDEVPGDGDTVCALADLPPPLLEDLLLSREGVLAPLRPAEDVGAELAGLGLQEAFMGGFLDDVGGTAVEVAVGFM